MGRQSAHKRDSLVEAADQLVYRQGFHETTLADIAAHTGIPLGNLYYYFKTKEDLGSAIIARRAKYYSDLAAEWGGKTDPKASVIAFVEYAEGRRERLSHSGCPIGSLCQELHKGEGGFLAEQAAALFVQQLKWLEGQFSAMGCGKASAGHALHLLSALQGAALLTHTFGNPELIQAEAARLKAWVKALQPSGR